jgi:uncharacterized protein (DUF885 family)
MRWSALLAVCACSAAPKSNSSGSGTEAFAALSTRAFDHLMHAEPATAISLGLHDYDGELPDITPAGIDERITALRTDKAALEAYTPRTRLEREERDTLVITIRGRLFDLVDADRLHKNPMAYTGAIDLDAYVTRDYAPEPARAAAVTRLCKQVPAYLERARANLAGPFPKPWVETSLMQTNGLAEFADQDARKELPDASAGLDTCKAALAAHAAWLQQQLPAATNDFALGPQRFVKMLADNEGIELDLAALTKLANDDLARNLEAIQSAAHAIDPNKSVAEVVAAVNADRPAPDQVLAVATQQAADMRQFLIDHHIVSLPGSKVAEVHPSLPFDRWNAASLSSPGPFEQKAMPSFYYISPPDPTWTPEMQRDYIPPRQTLLFTTIHEVYPGHFVNAIHMEQLQSRVLRSLWSYAMGEGWAHYTEEMMYDAGAGGHTPQAHIGQLEEALLRDVRFVVAIGEHTGGMTLAQAEALFRDKAFVDAGNAKQQAARGTFDPMFLAYTVGKLAIKKLRTDWMAKHPGATLGQFHDEFLAHGAAPLPVIRRAMLGDDAGPVL